MMRLIFLVLALLFGLIIAAAAMINNEIVTVNYFFGQISLTLFMLILGSAVAGALFMGSLSIYRGIHNYVNSQGDRGLKKELQNRVKTLEDEKKKMGDELSKQQKEREDAAAKALASLEDEKRNLEDELRKQQKDHENTVAKIHNS
ncbi:MAG: lipopolysaccharide assembly protein LapA domain-containing protein [Bacillota bacterium]|nr:lipopolysaccharide assembly protein LapA domain-containing protein [Bacillota bacterium]